MTELFKKTLFKKHQQQKLLPDAKVVTETAKGIIELLFPEYSKQQLDSIAALEQRFKQLLLNLKEQIDLLNPDKAENAVKVLSDKLPDLLRLLNWDIDALLEGDPAAKDRTEIIRTYPGFYAIALYRIAHLLHQQGVQLIPRILTEYAHSKTGIDIHPSATIGHHFFIDHGTGTVIGETVVIGNHVKIYQGATLGALSVAKNMASQKRHPTIGDRVVIYSGATILGGNTHIGNGSVIGGNVWLVQSVAANSRVYNNDSVQIHVSV